MRRGIVATLALLLLWGAAGSAFAHTRSVSYSSWNTHEGEAWVRLRVSQLELTRLGLNAAQTSDATKVGAYLADHLVLRAAGEPCERTESPASLTAPPGWVHYEWRLDCAQAESLEIETSILLDVAPGHLHFARVESVDGAVLERVLTDAQPGWKLESTVDATVERSGTTISGYVRLGIEHILSGWDHLAFLLALLLLASRVGEVATLVTGFTIAHSVTLGLAVLEILHPDGAAVEALIALSIALVAAENAWLMTGRGRAVPLAAVGMLAAMAVGASLGAGSIPFATAAGMTVFAACHFGMLRQVSNPARLRVAVAFAFGLIHGFGFAGVLADMELPLDRVAPALFGFNVGVELGQLSVVAISWPLLRWLESSAEGRFYRVFAGVGSAAVCGLGLFWFVVRLYG